jgi:hypothetical protein
MISIKYPKTKAGLLVLTFCLGMIGHASMSTNGQASTDIGTAGSGAPAAAYTDNRCKQQCAMRASQCDLACSQGQNALQCAQQCSTQYTQCISACN